jgi:alpha-L-fucosidase
VAWPAEGKHLWPVLEHYYELVPDGVVNDRWMPWSPLLATARIGLATRVIDAGAQRQAKRDGGLVPPTPPHFDVRTPEYVTFADIQPEPWECVRGMDRSFGYNAASRPEHFLDHDELLWSFVDILAKGGNLLLNVGPRGVDAQIPDEQLTRLGWLGRWIGPHQDAVTATRPWVTPGTMTSDGRPLRYTARDDTVYAFVRGATGPITLPDVRATPTTSVETLDGTPMPWQDSLTGLEIGLPPIASGPEPMVIALRRVEARAAASAPG